MIHIASGTLTRASARVVHANAQRTWKEREGILLELRSGSSVGLGEASPLPGYSRDDLATCAAELAQCWERLPAIDPDAPVRETLRVMVAAAGVRAPAAVFALEAALLDLIGKTRGRPAWALLRGDDEARAIPLSALAEGEATETLVEAARRAQARGIGVVKIKVGGPGCLGRDAERLAAVRAALGNTIALRLDANQALPADDLAEALRGLAVCRPELLEEPAPFEMLAALSPRKSPIPLALDESLMRDDATARIAAAAALGMHAAVILKPMSLGGFDRCLALADAASAAGLRIIVTHLFDGRIGSAAAACLALAIRGAILPCGLDPHERLEQPLAALSATHVVPFTASGLGVDGLTYH